MADSGQRTEQPTQRRQERARKEGQFTVSKEFVLGVEFCLFVAGLAAFAPGWLEGARGMVRFLLARGFQTELTTTEAVTLFQQTLWVVAGPLVAAGLLLKLGSFGVHMVVTGMGFSLERLMPRFDRLNPMARLRQLPRENLSQLVYAVVLLPFFGIAIYGVVADHLPVLLALPLVGLESGLAHVGASTESLLWKAAGLFVVLGAVDLFRQGRKHMRDMRMSRQEVREEMKETEGNPQARMRIRRLRRDLLRRKMMQEVPKATAIVVNPTHFAVAIRYVPEESAAPKVIAKGKNYLALRIRQKGVEHQIPIIENPPLAQALYKSAEVGQEIPVHLYRAVAEVLAYIFRLMNRRR